MNQFAGRTPDKRKKFGCLTVTDRYRAGLVEQQRVYVASRLDRFPGHGQHVETERAVDARDADSREQGADGGGNERDEQRYQIRDINPSLQINRNRRHRADHDQEDQREDGQQRGERQLVRRLLAFCAFDEMDHAI